MATRRSQTQKAGNRKSMPFSEAVSTGPTLEERVRFLAYLLFERRQHASVPGDAVSDWLHAERELAAVSRQFKKTRPVLGLDTRG